ncbi:MAG: hypothetical protein AAB382_11950 [Chloroflexota bacterium]
MFAGLAFLYLALYNDPKGALLILAVTVYILLDMLFPWAELESRERARRWVALGKSSMVLFAIFIATIATTAIWIGARHLTTPEQYANEGMLQVEAALKFLSQGISPYGQDYTNTPMGNRFFSNWGITVSPGLKHFVYMPLIVEISYPFYWLSLKTIGWWDQRMLHIGFLVLTLMLLSQLSEHPAHKAGLMLMVGLNPMLMLGFQEGRNDIIAIFWLALSALALQHNRRATAATFFALACASKQLVWFVAPFFLAYLLGLWPWRRAQWISVGRELLPGLIISLITIVPFLVWTPQAFVSDVLIYMMGASGTETFLANGYGLGGLLMGIGALKDPMGAFPFVWIELGVALPLVVWLGRRLIRQRRHTLIWQYGGVLALSVVYFHRFYHDNYIGLFTFLVAFGMLIDESVVYDDANHTR